jgi:GNAT superfamily N-acetyltransferase
MRFDVRAIDPKDHGFESALRSVLGLVREWAGDDPQEIRLDGFRTQAARRGLRLEPVFAAFDRGTMRACSLMIESPGRSAMVLHWPIEPSDLERLAGLETLRAVEKAAQRHGILLLQALLPPDRPNTQQMFQGAGFRHLTQLLYLRAAIRRTRPPAKSADGLEWSSFLPERQALFEEAIEATYEGSLDCPELNGVRRIQDVLESHRAAGDFAPDLWWVATRGNQPVGVLLLAAHSIQRNLEIVYLGVSRPARGTGVANALVARAFECGRRMEAQSLALAMDRRNIPARKLYDRWGFVPTGVREAWIATPCAS